MILFLLFLKFIFNKNYISVFKYSLFAIHLIEYPCMDILNIKMDFYIDWL